VSDDVAAQLRGLVDRAALQDCVNAYARGLDRLDEPLILSAFHPDATFANGDYTGSPAGFVTWLMGHQEGRDLVAHHQTNQGWDIADDEAHGETYFIAVIKLRDRPVLDVMGGRYVDRFERRGGVWRIAARVLLREWYFAGDAARMDEVLLTGLRIGTRDRSDVSYQRPLSVADWVSTNRGSASP
jgi:hypothetical protein